jgi:hypothetical protein
MIRAARYPRIEPAGIRICARIAVARSTPDRRPLTYTKMTSGELPRHVAHTSQVVQKSHKGYSTRDSLPPAKAIEDTSSLRAKAD